MKEHQNQSIKDTQNSQKNNGESQNQNYKDKDTQELKSIQKHNLLQQTNQMQIKDTNQHSQNEQYKNTGCDQSNNIVQSSSQNQNNSLYSIDNNQSIQHYESHGNQYPSQYSFQQQNKSENISQNNLSYHNQSFFSIHNEEEHLFTLQPQNKQQQNSIIIQDKNLEQVDVQETQIVRPNVHKSQSVIFNCSSCNNQSKIVEAVYVNFFDFENRRFLCRQCVKQSDKRLIPLKNGNHDPQILNCVRRIKINSQRPDRLKYRKYIQKQFQQVTEKLTNFISILNTTVKKFKNDIVHQYLAVVNTFNQNIIDLYLDKLKKAKTKQQMQELHLYNVAFGFASSRQFNYVNQIQQSVNVCFKNWINLIETQQKFTKQRFQRFQKNTQKFRITRVYDDKRQTAKKINQRAKLINQKKQLSPIRTQSTPLMPVQQMSAIFQSNTDAKRVKAKTNTLSQKPSSNVVVLDVDQDMPAPIVKSKLNANYQIEHSYGNNPSIHSSIAKPQFKTSGTVNNIIMNKPIRSNVSRNVLQDNILKQSAYTIQINIDNCSNIWQKQSKNKQRIKKVVIYYQNQYRLQNILTNIIQLNNLQQLIIYHRPLAEPSIINYYLQNVTGLKRLQLNCANQFQILKLVNQTKSKKFQSLQYLFYSCNVHMKMGLLDERELFLQDCKKPRIKGLNNKDLQILINMIPNLHNIWVPEPSQEILAKVIRMQHLKILQIGRKQQSSKILKMTRHCWQGLLKKQGLISLSLYKIQIDQNFLKLILVKNKNTLKTLLIHDCPGLVDNLLAVIKQNLDNLIELNISHCSDNFKGQDLWQIVSLQTLILRHCQSIDSGKVEQKIKLLNNLVHINLSGNQWLTDVIVKQICINKKLACAIFTNTNITQQSITYIKDLYYLKALGLGYTKIKGGKFAQLSNLKCLKKLSIKGLGSEPPNNKYPFNYFKQLSVIGSNITHIHNLDISFCSNIQQNALTNFQNLKFINLIQCPKIKDDKKKQLQKKGTIIITDIQ